MDGIAPASLPFLSTVNGKQKDKSAARDARCDSQISESIRATLARIRSGELSGGLAPPEMTTTTTGIKCPGTREENSNAIFRRNEFRPRRNFGGDSLPLSAPGFHAAPLPPLRDSCVGINARYTREITRCVQAPSARGDGKLRALFPSSS